MADWLMEREWPPNQYEPYQYPYNQFFQENPPPGQPPRVEPPYMQQHFMQPPMQSMPPMPPPEQTFALPMSPSLASLLNEPSTSHGPPYLNPTPPKPDNPREIRNKAEKQRRDKLNQSIGELASMVPPVVAASRKIDKTGVLRLTAHYLRAHQYVFGDSVAPEEPQFSAMSARALLSILNGFLLTTTYRGLIVVVSQNVQQYLGYTELDLLGQSVFNIIHEEDRQLMRDMLMPKPHMLGPNGELLLPDEPEGKSKVAEILSGEKRRFIIRFKKLGQRSEPSHYATCHIEGSLRKSDRACRGYNRCCQMVRRARARGDNPCNSGNDVVFVGIVRLATETFITESNMESFRMEYRTRHSIDGQIIQCEQRISLVTGYMTHEVNGINAMNFMHRDDVRWVVIALREMYDQHRLVGESCYRLLTKNGQFIYLKTRGKLDVDPQTRAVTSFVCTNTVVNEQEGKHLIKMMKKKFMLMVNNNEEPPPEEEIKDSNDQNLSVEDPRQLEKVILHLVTNLPSPQPSDEERGASPERLPPAGRLAIIPPKKERIVSAIEKIYSVIKHFPKELENVRNLRLGKVATTDTSNIVSNALIMKYHESPTSHSPQLAKESNHTSPFSQRSENPLPKLPNFSNVYQRRNAELVPSASMELSLTMYTPATPPPDNGLQGAGSPSTSYSGMATISLGNFMDKKINENDVQENALKYQLRMLPKANNVNINNDNKICNALPSATITGVKRPREYTESFDTEGVTKKKNADIAKTELLEEQNIIDETPLLDTLFDEELFNTSLSQIDTSMNSLAQSFDPAFPDLLVSQEVQDILQEIEENPTYVQRDT